MSQHSDQMVIVNMPDKGDVLAHIADFLGMQQWDSSTVEAIAELLEWNGYEIGECDE